MKPYDELMIVNNHLKNRVAQLECEYELIQKRMAIKDQRKKSIINK